MSDATGSRAANESPRYMLAPPEALKALDALLGYARKAAMQDVRCSFEEALGGHGGKLDAEDVERVLLGLEANDV